VRGRENEMAPSTRPYMGATPYNGGVTFRVWAPFASDVQVLGDFNNWKPGSHLYSEGNGYWSGDEPGAKVNQEYQYLIANAATGAALKRVDPYSRAFKTRGGPSLIAPSDTRWQDDSYRTPPWNELVIYELHVGTFVTDKTLSSPGGTFRSAATKLDYLRDLGINAIEVMALGEFESDTSWGYNPAYIFAIEDKYGGPNGFREFVHEAHRRGIAVIFDVVYNHLGYPAADMWQFDGWSENGEGGIYFYNDWRRKTPWGETRFDYGRPEVRNYIRDNARRWLEQRFVDGLRWDATGWIRNVYGHNNDPGNDLPDGWSLMQQINTEIKQSQPWKISIAEDMQGNEWLTKGAGEGGAGFDAQWEAEFVHAIRSAIVPTDDSARNMYSVRDAISHRYNGDAFERVVYTESHDEDANGHSRVPEEIWPGNAGSYFSRKRSTLGAALVFTAPGLPMVFQGQEFVENGYFTDARALDWGKQKTFSGIVSMYRDMIRLRRNWFNNTAGLKGQSMNVFHVNDADKVIAFHRWDRGGPGDDVIVVVNMANRAYGSYSIGFPRDGLWKVRFNSDWNGYSPDFGNTLSYDTAAGQPGRDSMPFGGNVGIGPYSAIILSQG
jgi:1,4-alpha-glucan branching enzyme